MKRKTLDFGGSIPTICLPLINMTIIRIPYI